MQVICPTVCVWGRGGGEGHYILKRAALTASAKLSQQLQIQLSRLKYFWYLVFSFNMIIQCDACVIIEVTLNTFYILFCMRDHYSFSCNITLVCTVMNKLILLYSQHCNHKIIELFYIILKRFQKNFNHICILITF